MKTLNRFVLSRVVVMCLHIVLKIFLPDTVNHVDILKCFYVLHTVANYLTAVLYDRGPAFSHAEFAVIVLPSYSHQYWTKSGRPTAQWDWMHCVNRVCSQVKKTVLLCYVEIPPPDVNDDYDVTPLLKGYSVREVSVKRWLPSRNRD